MVVELFRASSKLLWNVSAHQLHFRSDPPTPLFSERDGFSLNLPWNSARAPSSSSSSSFWANKRSRIVALSTVFSRERKRWSTTLGSATTTSSVRWFVIFGTRNNDALLAGYTRTASSGIELTALRARLHVGKGAPARPRFHLFFFFSPLFLFSLREWSRPFLSYFYFFFFFFFTKLLRRKWKVYFLVNRCCVTTFINIHNIFDF